MGQFIDITGQKFGRLTVLYRIDDPNSKNIKWRCRCECGNEIDVQGCHLRSGHTTSCGCKKSEPRKDLCDLTGMTFWNWTVIERAENYKDGSAMWLCECVCGKRMKKLGWSLKSGNSKSCGCVGLEVVREANTKHGMYDTRLYGIWSSMRDRCMNPNSSAYYSYGAKGIEVCDEWKDFIPFMEWALDNGYSDELSIDRIDNSKGYYPSNCRWVDNITQANNKSTNVLIELDDEIHTMAEWCRIKGLNYRIVASRRSLGWSDDELFLPPMKANQRKKYKGGNHAYSKTIHKEGL